MTGARRVQADDPHHTDGPPPTGAARGPAGVPDATHLLIEAARDYAIFMLDPTGHVATWNAGAQRMKGYAADEIVGRHFSAFYPPEALAAGWPDEELRIAAAEGRVEDEGWRVRRDGSTFWANVVITALYGPDGALLGFGKVTRDVTERRRLEAAAEEAAEAERQRLSYELHDDVAQRLAGASMLAYALEDRLREGGHPDAEAAARLAGLVRDTLTHARALSHALAPVDLLAEGLGAALKRLCASTEEAYGVRCRLDVVAGDRVTAPALATGLFRIAQEAVSNAARHAGAAEIVVTFRRDARETRLAVRDDGVGLPAGALSGHAPGLGLRSMRARAAALGGVLSVTPAHPGTAVTCVIPTAPLAE